MKKLLVIIDMQNDFINGSLGTTEAEAIVPNVLKKLLEYKDSGDDIVFTKDTHTENYLDTMEGKKLPVIHCIKDTIGWEICDLLKSHETKTFLKPTFGSLDLAHYIAANKYEDVLIVGLCTDICVISNALIIKAFSPEINISVDSSCCAGVTPESHLNALNAMKMCQINII